MNYSVPEFEVDDSIPTSSHLSRRIKSPKAGEDDSSMMELLWDNGQIVLHSQNQRSKPRSRFEAAAVEIRPEEQPPATQNNLFMEEDEMTDWLHYPIDDSSFAHDLISDLGYPAPTVTETPPAPAPPPTASIPVVREPASSAAAETGSSRPPAHPPRRDSSAGFQNFALFSRHRGRAEPAAQGSSYNSRREVTVADSNDTPAQALGGDVRCGDFSGGAAVAADRGKGIGRCELTSSALLRGSGAGASACAEPMQKPAIGDRKRKGREADDTNCHSEHDVDFDCPDLKRQGSGSIPVRKSRAAEVHNLSERKRRDRINEKMKALQELIPHSNKSDKASMLDEAIEYLKTLQLQVQMMSMGCSMVPMMFPGVQQYMTPMGMGMGMGMDMGMARPMMPYPPALSGSAMPPSTASAAHFGPRFPIPGYHMPPFQFPDPSRMQQQTTMPDPISNPLNAQNSHQPPQVPPNFADPYQQYLAFQQMQMQFPQNQAAMHPSSSTDANNHENLQSG